MAVIQATRKKQRNKINPLKIKKHSQIMGKRKSTTHMNEERIATETGFRSVGFENKQFATYYECMIARQATDYLVHAKKTKTVRILSGTGFVTTIKNYKDAQEDWVIERRSLISGDMLILVPNIAYRISSSSVPLDFVVSEDSKYKARLEVVKEASTTANVDLELLEQTDRTQVAKETAPPIPRRGSSRAAEQQKALAVKRGTEADKPAAHPVKALADSLNASPMNDFSEWE